MVARISLIGLSQDEILNQPMTGWRITSKRISSFLGRVCFRYVNIYFTNLALLSQNMAFYQTSKSKSVEKFVSFWPTFILYANDWLANHKIKDLLMDYDIVHSSENYVSGM